MNEKPDKIPSITSFNQHVSEAWQGFVDGFADARLGGVNCIVLDRVLATEAVGHAYSDLLRMSRLHLPLEDSHPDKHKYAGFLAKWIAKIKPVTIMSDLWQKQTGKEGYPQELHMLNAHFALYVFRSCLGYNIPGSMMDNLLYAFHFRDWSGENLALLAYACEEITRASQRTHPS